MPARPVSVGFSRRTASLPLGDGHWRSGARLVLVGSGLSTALGMPCWRSLLMDVAHAASSLDPATRDEILAYLSSPGEEYTAANKLAARLGKPAVEHQLRRRLQQVQDNIIANTQ